MRRTVMTLALACTVPAFAWLASAQAPQKLEYDTFCKLRDAQLKQQAFLGTTAENRGDLVRTQLERWRDANRARLKPLQLESLTKLIAAIGPETYGDTPSSEDQRVKVRSLIAAQTFLFTTEDIEAMQPTGPCIPKSK